MTRFDQDAAPLAPGMTRTRTEYRAKTARDLGPSFCWALAFAVPPGVVAGVVATWRHGFAWAGGAFFLAFLVLGAFVVFPGGAKVVHVVETVANVDLDGDKRIGPPPEVILHADVEHADGKVRPARARVPLAQVRAWRRFCQRVRDGDCNFSGRAAQRHEVDLKVFDAVFADWFSLDPNLTKIIPSSVGPQKTPKLNQAGEEAVAIFASTPLPQLMADLEGYTGAVSQQSGS